MVKKVYENIYMIEVSLPNNPLRVINAYLIKGKDKSLLIDTGFNREECISDMFNGLKELDVDVEKLELFITHLHSDHSGMASVFKEKGVKIYAGEIDGRMINRMTGTEYWENFDSYKFLFDLDRDNVDFSDHPGYKYCPKEPIDFHYLKEGDSIEVGQYKFEVIDVPGHTPGHIALYERKHKLFFGGDHILDQITPNIAFWDFSEDILATYFKNLNKISKFEIDYIFPSHRNIITDHPRRIGELLHHHEERLQEILDILATGEYTVRDVAAKMKWSIRAKDWEDFPTAQKWFAAGEAMSHLVHLGEIGKVTRELRDGKLYFKLK